jgi:hypothetical protein
MDAVFEALRDAKFVDDMAERAYRHVIGSGAYSYGTFIQMVDAEVAASAAQLDRRPAATVRLSASIEDPPTAISTHPLRAPAPQVIAVAAPAPEPARVMAQDPESAPASYVAAPAPEADPPINVPLPAVVLLPCTVTMDLVPPPPQLPAWSPPSRREIGMAKLKNVVVYTWQHLPPGVRPLLRPVARQGVLPAWRLVRGTYGKLRR